MFCKIIEFLLPTYTEYCVSGGPEPEIICQEWEIDEYGETINCSLPLVNNLPWDIQKLGRLVAGEKSGYSSRFITDLRPDSSYDVTIVLKALMTESIPPFTEEYYLMATMGGNVIRIYNNDEEFISQTFTIFADSNGEIQLNMKSTSSNYQIQSISGVCSIN
jgi:hypothetical protein